MRYTLAAIVVLAVVQAASAGMVITEWMYDGTDGEFVEFTNVGLVPVDMTGWSFDDNSRTPGSEILSGFGVVAPGLSVILTEVSAEDFALAWGLGGISIVGGVTNNLGRNDEINLYDADGTLVDRLTYNDQMGWGPRTQRSSCNIPAADYGFTTARSPADGWILAQVGDAYGSGASAQGDVGSPGLVVPEPGTLAIVLLGFTALFQRRA